MMLSQSRAACDACLKGAGGSIPYIEEPSKIAAVMQIGIDYALISRRNLSTEGAELSRALLIALGDYDGALTTWLAVPAAEVPLLRFNVEVLTGVCWRKTSLPFAGSPLEKSFCSAPVPPTLRLTMPWSPASPEPATT